MIFIANLVLEVLPFVVEKDRTNIRQMLAEGIAYLGRPQLDDYPKWKNKEVMAVAFMKELDLKKNNFYKVIKEYEETLQNV